MTNLLESSPAGLVVVAVDQTRRTSGRSSRGDRDDHAHSAPRISAPTSRTAIIRTPPTDSAQSCAEVPRRRSDTVDALEKRSIPSQGPCGPATARRSGEVSLFSTLGA